MRFAIYLSVVLAALVFFWVMPGGGAAPQSGDVSAAVGVAQRITPAFAHRVRFVCDSSISEPTVRAEGEQLVVSAGCVRECIRAYGWYLREVAGLHFSHNGSCADAASFVLPEAELRVPPTLPLNFAYNYCTYCYTGIHWDKERWMRELDMLALNGFRYILITPGLEKVWQGVLTDLGYSPDKIRAFIASPVYSAWWNMGNLEGEGAPVSQALIDREAELGRSMAQRVRELGMEPVLQGYVGFLPHDAAGFGSRLIDQGEWCGYKRPAVLAPDSDEFQRVAQLWYKHIKAVYACTPHAFAGDLFHEGGNIKGVELEKAAAGVQRAMQRFSPDCLWFIQAWGYNPLPGLLKGTSVSHTVILALQKDLSPTTGKTDYNFGGRRYVWCELANFGGKHGLYGGLDILEGMDARVGGASGLGLFSEGLETNPLYYELFYKRISHRSPIDRPAFLARYAQARYGSRDARLPEALALLARSVYTPDGRREGGLENLMCARPSPQVDRATTWSDPRPYYAPEDVRQAGLLLLEAAEADPALMQRDTLRYDLADVCRQVLADKARAQLAKSLAAFHIGDEDAFQREGAVFCAMIEQMADLLATHEDFLLGRFLQGVAARAGQEDAAALQRDVLRLITRWSPDIGSLNDYAHRHFAELMRHYYLPRWRAFFAASTPGEVSIVREVSNSNNGVRVRSTWQESAPIEAIERALSLESLPLITEPRGDLLKLAEQILR